MIAVLMTPFRFPTRDSTLQTLASETFDVLVLGGGITGAGIARDAALRGLRVALVEKSDFASGTSSKSSKLVHGGLRYLQQAHFGLVSEALHERTLLQTLAPHLVRPLPFLFPVYKQQSPGKMALRAGLWLYDRFARTPKPRQHHMFNAIEILQKEPGLHPTHLQGGALYYDSQTDDARLTLENVMDAAAHGAVVVSYAAAIDLYSSNHHIQGAFVRDQLGSLAPFLIKSRVVVNATGPWADQILQKTQANPAKPLLRPTKGVHLVLDDIKLSLQQAIVMKAPQDGRIVFALPWHPPGQPHGKRTILGTTDTDFTGNPDFVYAEAADVDYLLTCANAYFPKVCLQPQDVCSTWAGLRPLIAPASAQNNASAVSREHAILQQPGLVTIAGGKLTTYRVMAAQTVDMVLRQLGHSPKDKPCTTHQVRLPGGHQLSVTGLPELIQEIQSSIQDETLATHLAWTYGTRAKQMVPLLHNLVGRQKLHSDFSYVLAEVDWAVQVEGALRIEDVLARRIPLLLQSREQGQSCLQQVADRMGQLLHWSDATKQAECKRYLDLAAASSPDHFMSNSNASLGVI